MAEPKFKIAFAIDAQEFLKSIPDSAREKIYYNIRRVLYGEINNELFKKLENSDGIWEFRTLYQKIAYRLFAFWDTESDTLIVATHGIIKKTQKTPSKEIAKAEKLKEIYFNNKRKESNMEDLKLKSFDEMQDEFFGKIGTPKRDAFEKKVEEAYQEYKMGEAIKQARKANNLTQEQLGEKIGVQKSQISRLERGHGITFSTMARIFKAMNIPAFLDMGAAGKVALW